MWSKVLTWMLFKGAERPLKPERHSEKHPTKSATVGSSLSYQALVNVVRAVNIPTRQESEEMISGQNCIDDFIQFSIYDQMIRNGDSIQGTFQVCVPPLIYGYSLSAKFDDAASALPHLQVFIAIDPVPAVPKPFLEQFDSFEKVDLLQYADKWLTKLVRSFPDRVFAPLVLDVDGRRVFSARFLRPIRPPNEVMALQSNKTAAAVNRVLCLSLTFICEQIFQELACHIVSLIPVIGFCNFETAVYYIWNTSDEFLRILHGNLEDHAILLWCWLKALDITCYLLLGTGPINGPHTVYVLAFLPTPMLFNAIDGTVIFVSKAYHLQFDVGCAITNENVWANVQDQCNICCISLNFESSSLWSPFWSAKFPKQGTFSVQPEILDYVSTTVGAAVKVETRLRKILIDRFMSWRPRILTRFNRYAGQILRNALLK
ncbi:unnamed protein product [Soboliphyme baturini]|uniref:UDENN domain-containing protein n=1 Tax=Soboliphyme baturini TaxID=241478 RepID=A0A183IVB8_9BILA|nr:unnamed protein product [Soboliphyme baturini]